MSRENIKINISKIIAFAEGKIIERPTQMGWVEVTDPNFNDFTDYRISPKATKCEYTDICKYIAENGQCSQECNHLIK